MNGFRHRWWVLWLAVCSAFAVPARGATFHVSETGSDVSGTTGADWANAFRSISNAVAHTTSAGADTIWVSNGTYHVKAEIQVLNDTRIRSVNGPDATIVRHDQSTGSRLFYLNNAGAVLDGLTISNVLTSVTGNGGGVYIHSGGGTLHNCRVIGHRSSAGTRHGLGVYAAGSCLITNCVIANNYTYHPDVGNGPGVYLAGAGVLVNSTIVGNRGRDGAGVFVAGNNAVLRNCLVIGNRANYQGGGVMVNNPSGVVIENCTIANNMCKQWGGGVWHNVGNALTLRNCIVYHNAASLGANYYWTDASTLVTHTCLTPLKAGEGNMDAVPDFFDPGLPYTDRYDNQNAVHAAYRAVLGDYRLRPGSPCINTGTNQASWMPGSTDRAGNPRIVGGIVDMGAYEVTNRALVCSIRAGAAEAFSPAETVLTAHVDGTNLTGLTYTWDFGDGSPAVSGADKRVVTNLYAAGVYSPALTVMNAVSETASSTRTNYLRFGPEHLYVAPATTPLFPYASWTTAATNIWTAVTAAVGGSTVWVTNGTYTHPSPHILIEKPITVRSVNGYAVTTVDGQNARRNFFLDHPDCTVDGFTIRRGLGNQLPVTMGAGLYIWSGGSVYNCWIRGNSSAAWHVGGVYNMAGGNLRNCILSENQGAGKAGLHNVIGMKVHNCLITRNTSGYPNRLDGCGIVTGSSGEFVNCIVIHNTNSNAGGAGMPDIYLDHTSASAKFHHTLCPHATNRWATFGVNNITNQSPAFLDAVGGDYRLVFDSPGMDAGSNLTWVVEAGAADMGGKQRLARKIVDLGPYEVPPRRGTVLLVR